VKEILQQTRIFLVLFACYLLIPGFILLMTAKGQFEIWLNSFHTTYFDNFFYWVTYFGDGFFAAFLLIGLILFFSIRKGLIITGILLAVSVVTQVLKLFVFPTMDRPSVYLKDVLELHFVKGLEIHTSNSFPSGHTTQAFCLFFLFSYYYANRSMNYLFFLLAVLAGISRVYLLQHFLIDIYAGAVIGSLGSLILLFYVNKYNLLSSPALNKPLISIR
jgi:membrane-associated phospholipid phosphatase